MNSLYSYFWPSAENLEPKKIIISPGDLKKVNLTRTEVKPITSIDTFELNIHNKAQLNEILNMKLKPTKVNIKPTYYPPRNPVVKQLNEKFGIGI
jgi:hypothetical protein